jgi:hypothetical protein
MAKHRGRIARLMGVEALVESANVVGTVRCAVVSTAWPSANWASRRAAHLLPGVSGRPVRQEHAQGILIAALGMLAD